MMQCAIVNGRFGAPQPRKLSVAPAPPSSSATASDDIPVYVINLRKDMDRWCRIETALRTLGISPIRIKALNGTARHSLIRRLIKHDFATKDWALTPGEIGCALSHIGVWKKVARHGLAAIVLEDDAEIVPAFKHFYFDDLPLFLQRCDVVKFEGLFFQNTSRTGPILCDSHSTKLIVSLRPTLGAAGYALTPRGAEALLSRAAKIKVSVPIDHLLARYDEHGAVYGETRPLIVRQATDAFASNIESERIIQGKRMTRILNSRSATIRHVRRTCKLIKLGIRRSIAMTRIIFIARLHRDQASLKRASTKRELSWRAFRISLMIGLPLRTRSPTLRLFKNWQ